MESEFIVLNKGEEVVKRFEIAQRIFCVDQNQC